MLDILQQIGLTPSESKIYTALLETGKNTATGILNQAKLNSGRIYEVLTSLENKGLVSSVKEGRVRYFQAAPPERVLDYLNQKIDTVNAQKNNFEKVLPMLKKSYVNTQQKTDVEVFLGVKGQKTAYDILLAEAEKNKDKELIILGVAQKEKYPKEVLDLLRFHVYKRRKELKLKVKKIADPKGKNEKMYTEDNSEIRYLPFTSTTALEVLGDVTMVILYSEPIITIIIRNKNVAEDYKKQLKFLWSIAKK
jgi:sugar-specific transcriptional regulator TrmB